MNVIFLDFDGVIVTRHLTSDNDLENKIRVLSDICKEYNCKVVIEAASKDSIDELTMEVRKGSFAERIFNLFNKYGIECIGRTPNVEIKLNEHSYIPIWKEEEILSYLKDHPEIEHYCVIDDDDLKNTGKKSDLDKVREHLVEPIYWSDNHSEEGLLPKHKEEVGKVLKKEIKRLD